MTDTRFLIVFALAVCGVGACGIDRGGAPIDTQPTVQTTTDAIVGPISAVGANSLTVDGQLIDVSNASFALNGTAADLSMFVTGMQISAATRVATGGTAAGLSINAQMSVAGPLERFDSMSGEFDILAATIRTDAATAFAAGAGVSGAAIGTPFAVSGYSDASGGVLATFVGAHTGSDVRRSGFASAIDPATMTLRIGATVVDYSQAAVVSLAQSAPQDGERLTVSASGAAGGALLAATIESTPLLPPGVGAGSAIQLSGFVTAFVADDDFAVAQQSVQLAAGATLTGGSTADLNVGRLVLLHGTLDAQQRIVAERVAFLD